METIGVLLGEMCISDDSRYQHRLHGVLLVAHGLSCRQVAAWWGVDAGRVAAWVCRFKEIGFLGLRDVEFDLSSPERIRPPVLLQGQGSKRPMTTFLRSPAGLAITVLARGQLGAIDGPVPQAFPQANSQAPLHPDPAPS